MNAGIVILADGTPCITYDEALRHKVRYVEFDPEDYQVTLIYDLPGPRQGWKFEYPLDHPFVSLLKERGNVALSLVKDGQVVDLDIYPVFFLD